MNTNYDDIIHLPHHVSRRHRAMSMEKRAAQFAPFAALTGYEDAIEETARVTDEAPDLEMDARAALQRKLAELRSRLEQKNKGLVEATVTFFVPDSRKEGGHFETLQGSVRSIEEIPHRLLMSDGTRIDITRIIDLGVVGGCPPSSFTNDT